MGWAWYPVFWQQVIGGSQVCLPDAHSLSVGGGPGIRACFYEMVMIRTQCGSSYYRYWGLAVEWKSIDSHAWRTSNYSSSNSLSHICIHTPPTFLLSDISASEFISSWGRLWLLVSSSLQGVKVRTMLLYCHWSQFSPIWPLRANVVPDIWR